MLSLEVDSDGFTSAAPSLSTSSSRETDEGAFAVSKSAGAKPRRVWTAVEDAAISQLVTEVGSQSWSLIAGITHALLCLP
jgi:hypothetical protein